MPYRARDKPSRGPSALVYAPSPRGKAGKLADALLLVATIGVLVSQVRAQRIECAWEGTRARCTWSTENALGQRTEQTVGGIHGVAYRSGTTVDLVTDAQNKDKDAAFGTRAIDMWDEPSALALRQFADEPGSTLSLATGPAHPLLLTLLVLVALCGYAIATRPPVFELAVDDRERILSLRKRGPFSRAARYELESVRDVDVENAAPGQHRVRLVLADGTTRPFTAGFYPGDRHHAFARAAREVVRAARGDVTLEDA